MPRTRYYWDKRISANKLIALPYITNLSELSLQVEWQCDVDHPSLNDYYPLAPIGKTSYRVRNLAIGGAFRPGYSYRRELAGHLHYGKRCQICLEVFTWLGYHTDFDMLLCDRCHSGYTLSKF